jgi:hypothetical protein
LHGLGHSICCGRSKGANESGLESAEERTAPSEAALDVAKEEQRSKRDTDRCEHGVFGSGHEHVRQERDQSADDIG